MNADTFVGVAMIVTSLAMLVVWAKDRAYFYVTYEDTATGREYAWIAGNRGRARRHLLHMGIDVTPTPASAHLYRVARRVRAY